MYLPTTPCKGPPDHQEKKIKQFGRSQVHPVLSVFSHQTLYSAWGPSTGFDEGQCAEETISLKPSSASGQCFTHHKLEAPHNILPTLQYSESCNDFNLLIY